MLGIRRALLVGLLCSCLRSPEASQAETPGPLLIRAYPSLETSGVADADLDWEVYDVAEVDRRTWLATQQGLYELVGGKPRRLEAIKAPVFAVEDVGGEVWVGALEGVYRIRAGVIEQVSGGGAVARVHAIPDYGVFASTPGGAVFFAWADATGQDVPEGRPVAGISSSLTVVERLATGVWLGTLNTLYQLDATLQATPVSADAPLGEVLFLEEWDDRVWFVVTDRGSPREATVLTRLADGSIEPAFRVRLGNVTYLGKLEDVLYLGTNFGFYEVVKVTGGYDRKRLLERENNPINGLFEADGHRYLVTDSRLFLQLAGGWLESPPPSYTSPLHLTGGDLIASKPTAWGSQGAFHLEPGGRIEVRFEGRLEDGKLVPPGLIKVSDIRLLNEQGQPLAAQPRIQDFQLKVSFLRDEVQANGGGAGWVAAHEVNKLLDCTRSKFYYLARDRWHNSAQGEVEFACGGEEDDPWLRTALLWLAGGVPAASLLLLLLLIVLSGKLRGARKLLSTLLKNEKP